MQQRLTAILAAAIFIGLGLGGLLLAAGAASPPAERISFQIATGSTAGTFFPVGEAIAGLISHPPGVDRCEAAPVCGPAGLIVSARTSEGAVDNITEVNDGDAESGLARGDVVAAAVAGAWPFRGKASHLRVIASLYNEDVQLVARPDIRSVADLRGKRLSGGAGAGIAMREVLGAYGIGLKSLKLVTAQDGDATLLRAGKIDAFFTVGNAPAPDLADLFAAGQARLVPIDGKGRDRLIKTVPAFAPVTIAANIYPGQSEIQTVATRALWIVRDSVPDNLVYGITQALFNPMNRPALIASHPSAREIGLADAAMDLPAPLHPGAARFYQAHRTQR